ncbi:hypothetical protein D910_07493 [Dendroctonus ponderosae]
MKASGTVSIKPSAVKNALQGVIKVASENPHLQKQLFHEDFPLFLQINAFKIPKSRGTNKQVYRIPLANSPLNSDADICLIVPDVKGIPNKEHERHVEHYEKLLEAKGVTGIKKIMTFHEFRTEYETFELKNRLVDLYDQFLVDGKISGKVVHKCGSIFYKKRKVPISIKLQATNLKSEFEKALKRTFFLLSWKSDSHAVQIGNSKMSIKSLTENVFSIVQFIEKEFPGKMDNVRSLNIYAYRGSSVPIYISLRNPNEIQVPELAIKKTPKLKTVRGELTTFNNADVVVRPSGKVIVKHLKNTTEVVKEVEDVTTEESTEAGYEKQKGKKRKLSEMKSGGTKRKQSPKKKVV